MAKRILALLLTLSLILSMGTGCDISSKHMEVSYGDNDNENISNWDDVDNDNVSDWDDDTVVSTWSDIDEYSDWVYSQILFEDITDQYPIVVSNVLDYRSNGQYFDGEVIYSLVGDKFDANSFVAKYAVGTGVIVICVVLTVATAGGSTPVACFIAGAADGAVSMATKGAAFGAAVEAISVAIKGGDIDETLYGALEGSADGYMWGAMYGAITGGFNSTFCFEGSTLVQTQSGQVPISSICIGDLVYSYDQSTGTYAYKPVTQVDINHTDITVDIRINGETVTTTYNHPFLTEHGWMVAGEISSGTRIWTAAGTYAEVEESSIIHQEQEIPVYNLCVGDYNTYTVGCSQLVVHNRCNINSDYAGKTKYLDDPELAKKYPDGVPFTDAAFPDFSQYAVKTVKCQPVSSSALNATDDAMKCLTGVNSHDFALANRLAGYSSTPKGYTWHHCEDMMSLQLIPTDLHMAVRHTGGASLLRSLIAGLIP